MFKYLSQLFLTALVSVLSPVLDSVILDHISVVTRNFVPSLLDLIVCRPSGNPSGVSTSCGAPSGCSCP